MNLPNSPSDEILSVMYCKCTNIDLVNEKYGPHQAIAVLSYFFEQIEKVASDYSGEIGPRHSGSQLLFFQNPDQAIAGAEMLFRLAESWRTHSGSNSTFRIGVGLSHGRILQGRFQEQKMFHGEVVQEAMILVNRFSNYQLEILSTESFLKASNAMPHSWRVDSGRLSTNHRISPIYEIYRHRPNPEQSLRRKWEYALSDTLDEYFSLHMQSANSGFQNLLEAFPEGTSLNVYATIFRERTDELLFKHGSTDVLDHLHQAGVLEDAQ